MTRTIKVKDGQSLLDIALQECGDVAAAYAIADLNGMSVSDSLEVGSELQVPAGVDDQEVVSLFAGVHKPASTETDATSDINGEGLEFWVIERDFIIE